jgi:prophage antirepressor-like protein
VTGLQVFEFGGRKVRTAGTHEAPLFCAADVCEILALGNVAQACGRLDQDEAELVADPAKFSHESTGPGTGKRTYKVLYVTESGLFSLIFDSRKPEAKAFKKWVTSEVLPEIRKRGYYSAIEVETRRQTERLLEAIFPHAPSKAKPIFSDLIAALLVMRHEDRSANPPWAKSLARLVYDWALPVDGQQKQRRLLNVAPNGSRVDHSMLSEDARANVITVARVGVALAKNSMSWGEWRARMDTAFNDAPLQLSLVTPIRRLPKKGGR